MLIPGMIVETSKPFTTIKGSLMLKWNTCLLFKGGKCNFNIRGGAGIIYPKTFVQDINIPKPQ